MSDNLLANDLIIYMLKVLSEGIRCEFCCEDVSLKDLCYEVGSVEDLMDERIYCIFCDNENIVTEDHIYRYYRLERGDRV